MCIMCSGLGCGFPVSLADFRLCLHKFCGEADRGRLAGQRGEFKTHRKSTAQVVVQSATKSYEWQALPGGWQI